MNVDAFSVERVITVAREPCIDDDLLVRRRASTKETLRNVKERVRVFMDTTGEEQWRRVVFQPPPRWTVPRPKPASRAYYKMWEIAHACALPVPRRSLHLCEAPGGFVEACVDAFPGVDWLATSLRADANAPSFAHPLKKASSASDVPRIWDSTAKTHAGSRNDLLDEEVRDELVAFAMQRGGADLVTADGAAPMDHADLEESAFSLASAQADVALRTCAPGGTFVLKIFEGCCAETTQALVCKLASHFENVSLIKPTHSRPTNSERYVVCTGRAAPREVGEGVASYVDAVLTSYADDQIDALERALTQTQPGRKRTR